jgi:hypothetical protein
MTQAILIEPKCHQGPGLIPRLMKFEPDDMTKMIVLWFIKGDDLDKPYSFVEFPVSKAEMLAAAIVEVAKEMKGS